MMRWNTNYDDFNGSHGFCQEDNYEEDFYKKKLIHALVDSSLGGRL